MIKRAHIDTSKKYRYSLERIWGTDHRNIVNFILLNPSIADAEIDDPTIKRCIAFAKSWKFEGLIVTNLFAFRATDPKVMKSCQNPNGFENDKFIKEIAKESKKVVVAWGNNGSHCHRDREVLAMLGKIKELYCLGINASGTPKHPLYMKGKVKPILFKIS